MKYIKEIKENPISQLYIGVVFLMLSVAFVVILSRIQVRPAQNTQSTTASPAPAESFTKPEFSQNEAQYPEATPQVFRELDGSHTGALVVTSNPLQIQVVIKADDPESDFLNLPVNQTPFKVTELPVGKYILTATAKGYQSKSVPVQLMENQVNRVSIDLTTLP